MQPLRPDLKIKLDVLMSEIEEAGGLEPYYDKLFGKGSYANDQKTHDLNADDMMSFAIGWVRVMK